MAHGQLLLQPMTRMALPRRSRPGAIAMLTIPTAVPSQHRFLLSRVFVRRPRPRYLQSSLQVIRLIIMVSSAVATMSH